MVEDSLKKFGETKVSEIMIYNPLYITPGEKISATELLMLRKNIGGLPVVKDSIGKKLVGIITQRDIRLARFAMSLESPNKTVKDLMTPEPFVIKKDTTIKNALDLMFDKNIERLPVVNERNELIGLLLQNHILKSLLNHLKQYT
ncbi:MAG: CBS domain-containing protein [Promethearchaeota archaeon]